MYPLKLVAGSRVEEESGDEGDEGAGGDEEAGEAGGEMTNTSAYLGLLRLRSVQVARHKSLTTSDK
ncbi:hypothetical protein [Nostoc favosum]|uniref:Uncharacterized protein n=1 Tax=Nostoc favosum CHAB5714 TaxID=2780399 RepID=A0ABS8IEN7_9NOSO|nr:hypothetical protein [Nostoc favosum]MCC5602687.1 hypothetical protein [Nostoc favosum CHAB5714]